jgi:hypothetical protein
VKTVMTEIIGNEITRNIITGMINDGFIPASGPFEVTQSLLDMYYEIFTINYPVMANKHRKKEVRYYKKLTGLSLLKMSLSRTETQEREEKINLKPKLKCGILYLISNPVYPGMYKVGITQDLNKRLATYQTYDPFRRFKVEHYRFVDDMRIEEKTILSKYQINISTGEWIDNKKVKEIFMDW